VHCHAGCTTQAVTEALGLKLSDLRTTETVLPPARPTPTISTRTPKPSDGPGKWVATYPYTDEQGELLFQVLRYEPKAFRQRKPDGAGGWAYKLDEVRRVVYRLPELLEPDADRFIFIVEGEKDVDALKSEGLFATTTPQGAGNAHHADLTPLYGHHLRTC